MSTNKILGFALAMIACLTTTACQGVVVTPSPTPVVDFMADVMPPINYPNFYIFALSFGFTLPENWHGEWNQSQQMINMVHGAYGLELTYEFEYEAGPADPPPSLSPDGMVELRGMDRSAQYRNIGC